MTTYEIPLTPEAQTFSIDLAGVTYSCHLLWNGVSNSWTLDIADENDNAILSGISVVSNADLLAPYPHLNFGGQLIAQTDTDPDEIINYESLGVSGHIYFVTP